MARRSPEDPKAIQKASMHRPIAPKKFYGGGTATPQRETVLFYRDQVETSTRHNEHRQQILVTDPPELTEVFSPHRSVHPSVAKAFPPTVTIEATEHDVVIVVRADDNKRRGGVVNERLIVDEDVVAELHPSMQQPSLSQRRAQNILDTWAIFLPARSVNEELGDYLEDINRRATAGQGRFKIYLRMLASMFWTGVNAVGYFLKAIGKRKAA
jgi:hypothetical protein